MKNVLIAAVLFTSTAFAADAGTPAAPAAQGPKGVRGDILFWLHDAESKLVQLAETIPEGKYKWKPAKESRTTTAVFMHVASANFGIPHFAGVATPEGFNHETYEKSLTKKADVVKALKDSFVHATTALEKTADADLEKQVEFFGQKSSVRGVWLLVLSHAHEHLGQAIVHARASGIAPPWTAAMKKEFEKMKNEAKK
ncbi:MAG: DinB family protein [Myxococcaceae bacterium]